MQSFSYKPFSFLHLFTQDQVLGQLGWPPPPEGLQLLHWDPCRPRGLGGIGGKEAPLPFRPGLESRTSREEKDLGVSEQDMILALHEIWSFSGCQSRR